MTPASGELPSIAPRRRWTTALKAAVGLLAAGGFAWLLARELDIDALGRAFARLSSASIVLAAGFAMAAQAVRIVRWWRMLRILEPGLPLVACVRPFLASVAFNNVLPLRAGDALRVFGFRRQLRSPAARVLGTLVVERALDVVFLSGILFSGLLGLPGGVFPHGFVVASAWLTGTAGAALLAAVFLRPFFERARKRFVHAASPGAESLARRRWTQAIARHGAHLAEALGVVRSARTMIALCALSAAVWACEGAAFVVIAANLGAGAAGGGPWLSLAAGSLATAIPSAPGYVGTFDYFAALGASAYGATPEAAAALALTVHALWVPVTAAGLLCYWAPPTHRHSASLGAPR